MYTDILLGLQWGDEGKGKIVDYLADKYDIIARFQGGPNAGHTLVIDGVKTVLHTIPSGILKPGIMNVIGNGVVIDPTTLLKEINQLEAKGVEVKKHLLISKRAHLILPTHKILDAASEAAKGAEKIGSTLRGIGPTYMDKTGRNGLRIGDMLEKDFRQRYEKIRDKHLHLLTLYNFDFSLKEIEAQWFESIEQLSSLQFIDAEYYLNNALRSDKKILAEGAQGTMLDIDFGTYPFVTSSNTVTAAACNGLGIAPSKVREVIGIAKAYCTRVGGGPFPTELHDAVGDKIRSQGNEFGATTGRPRRCGWFDLPAMHYACMINGVTQIAITKADVLNNFEQIDVCTAYEIDGKQMQEIPFDMIGKQITPVYKSVEGWQQSLESFKEFSELPAQLTNYMNFLSKELNTPISMLSTGPGREELLVRK
ncbi:MAG: adenylosuccinate synthase [Chitinophagales bacterium]|nr:adenylosuccinate synthase [Chitinophagales bacterium]OJV23745.1 MAG: adenylosuccinate synthase [Bacteroidetes bacterium 37-13]HRN94132.1 adenylosuccinate synthase [Chitinophagales bacterium]HRP40450.1 adenylosuccinate synthase [Chitinophagales bacterium]